MIAGVDLSELKLLIGGELVPGDLAMDVVNPALGRVAASAPRASTAQADAAVEAAFSAFPAWAATPLDERRAALRAFADRIEANVEQLAAVLTFEHGRPLGPGKAEGLGAVALLRQAAGFDLGPEVLDLSDSRRVERRYRPLGVVAAILPWNAPLWLFAAKAAPALIAGNTIVIKPGATTPLTALLLARWAADLFPPGVINVITDADDLGGVLTRHPKVRKITFTGSTATGRRVFAAAADDLKRMTLELGGNDAAVVLADADIDAVAPWIFEAAFRNSGQICMAVKRVYAHRSIYEALVEALASQARSVVVGDGTQPGVQYGPLQNRAQYDRVMAMLSEASGLGRIVAGGPEGDGGFFIRPTIVADLPWSSRLVEEEQFGPVLPVVPFDDEAAVLEHINAGPFGLGGSVWSADVNHAADVAATIEAGIVWVNQHLATDPTIAAGGAKQSGVGVELGRDGMLEFTQPQIVNVSLK